MAEENFLYNEKKRYHCISHLQFWKLDENIGESTHYWEKMTAVLESYI